MRLWGGRFDATSSEVDPVEAEAIAAFSRSIDLDAALADRKSVV